MEIYSENVSQAYCIRYERLRRVSIKYEIIAK